MFGRKRRITVIVATRNGGALAALEEAGKDLPLARREALSTDGVYRALPGAHLAVVDLDALVESPGVPRERLVQVFAGSGLVVTDGQAFAADPARYLNQARAASGLAEALPGRRVAFTGLSGGVGKTTLALSLASHFRRRTGLPVVVVELCPGPSGLLALVGEGDGQSHLYEVTTQGKGWPVWNGVTLAPMDWQTARLLEREQVAEAWRALADTHVLAVFDGPASHPLWPTAAQLVDAIFAVADGRPDALASAAYLASQGAVLGRTEGPSPNEDDGRPQILLNRGGVAARLALGHAPAVTLPDVGRSARGFPARLGRPLMRLIYPGWRK
jgi:hypothetical protein